MTKPISQKTYEAIAAKWAKIINAHENGIDIWPPISGGYVRVRQFLADNSLQQKLLSKNCKLYLIHTEGMGIDSYDDLDKQFALNLGFQPATTPSLQKWITEQKSQVVFFITGLDVYLQKGELLALNYLNTLTRQNKNVSVIIITGVNIIDVVGKRAAMEYSFFQNCEYIPLYRERDSIQMLKSLEHDWHFTMPLTTKKELIEKIGGQFFLLKAAARIARDNPQASIKTILQSPSLKRKGIAVFEGLISQDQQTVLHALEGKYDKASEYLDQVKILHNHTLGIAYWRYIKKDLLELYTSPGRAFYLLDVYLTSIEREVFDILHEKKNVVTRENIAQTIWRNEWVSRYSDWAIDQTIHRIREKLDKVKAPYEIVTKKGEGFILVEN